MACNRYAKLLFLAIIFFVLGCKIEKNQIELCEQIEREGENVCKNGGFVKYSIKSGHSCWCPLGYDGKQCQTKKPVSFMASAKGQFDLGNSDLSRGKPTMWWSKLPLTWEHTLKTNYAFHQSVVKSLENGITGAVNDGYTARILLPESPLKCCVNYHKKLPPLKELYNGIFKRIPCLFIPDRNNRNLLYGAFYQYFVLQFFDANSNLKVTASQLYGSDLVSEKSMRSFSSGKLKALKFNDKYNALNQALNALTKTISTDGSWNSWLWIFKRTDMLSARPMLFVLSTLWVREHNQVCDELSRKWPLWGDDKLYTTARNIVTGQMMTIMMNEILKVDLSPEVYHHRMENIHSSGTPIELYLTMAVSSLPEKLQCESTKLTSFSNTRQVSEASLKNALKCMVNLNMGMVTAHNDGALTEQFTKTLMKLSRKHRLQGFNNYRRQLGLPAYKSFLDMTGNVKTAFELEKMYSSVENVEFLTGVLTERSSSGASPTAEVLTNSFIINAILTNDLTTYHSWVPDMFGGFKFFTLVKSACLKKLVCRNSDINCDESNVGLYVKYVD